MNEQRSHTTSGSRRIINCRTQGRRWNNYVVTFVDGEPVEVLARVTGRYGARDSTRLLWKTGREMSITAACAVRAAQAHLSDEEKSL